MSRESMEFDIVIVGAGPAGLSAAIRLAQLDKNLTICVLEKGDTVGAHTLSGAVLEPRALDELIPDWQTKQAPLSTPVTQDQFLFLSAKRAYSLPTPSLMHNTGNYIISLGQFCRWLAKEAERLGVNIFTGFAASDMIYENNSVCGVITGDKGIDKNGNPTSRYQSGIALRAKHTFFAEGCRGSLTQQLFERFQLRTQCDVQTYALGLKELWEVPPELHQPGSVMHSIGWPLDSKTYGGSFAYHFSKNLFSIGLVIGLDYQNPYLNPYEEFQRLKTHSIFASLLRHSKRIAYGARCLNEGGIQSIPKLTFPGGLIIGCGAGFINVPKIKGIHNAMKSGMVAAESVFSLLKHSSNIECIDYPQQLKKTWLWKELYQVRNFRPAMKWGLWPGLAYAALESYLFRGHTPWTFRHHQPDHLQLKPAATFSPITYPKHDNVITFDLPTSLYLANLNYTENQPCHLKLKNPEIPITLNLKKYAFPEQRYCPAGVYEIIPTTFPPTFQINASNCLQCKACDIKDPSQNIVWTTPEGGNGPDYRGIM